LVAIASSPEESKKEVQINHSTNKYLSFGEKIVKIGSVDPDIVGLWVIIKKQQKKKKN